MNSSKKKSNMYAQFLVATQFQEFYNQAGMYNELYLKIGIIQINENKQ